MNAFAMGSVGTLGHLLFAGRIMGILCKKAPL